jgi:phage anti-repressor protein
MTELNIVELIENQPIGRLTDTYNVKLLDKIKEKFSNEEQQLFIASFYCYLNYDTEKDFMVDLDDVWKWLGFNKKYNATIALHKHFMENVDYINLAPYESGARSDDEKWGGQNIKKIMMTINCFKSLCLKAQTTKAYDIHKYYLKMEKLLNEVIGEESMEFKQIIEEQKRLLDQKEEALVQKDEALTKAPELERHKLLLRKYGQITGSLVYIVRIKEGDNGTYIIKIGESRKGIKNRLTEFKQKYGNQVLILECFPVHDSAGLEKHLHHHPEIHPHQVKNLEGHETEQELFLMGGVLTYQRLLDIIDTCQSQFHYLPSDYELLKLENEKLRSQTPTVSTSSMDHTILQEILKTNQLLLQKVQTLEATNKEIIIRLNAMQTKTTTACSQPDPHLGPRLQKIHPETLQILHVYETVTECMKEDHAMKRPSINKAVRENTIYRGFRWQLIDRELDPHTAQTLAPTKATKPQKNGYVAKVNQEQTEILHVYLDRKTAAQVNNYPSIASLDNAVKNHTIKDGHYYQLYEECDALKSRFQEKHGTIVLYHDGIGQYDAQHTLISEFTSRFECTVRAGISQKSLAKVLNKPLLYKEWYFKSLGEKRYV